MHKLLDIIQNPEKNAAYQAIRSQLISPEKLVLNAKKYTIFTIEEIKVIAEQLISQKKAIDKIPEWNTNPAVILPPPLSIEQASSEKTAMLKASLFQKKLSNINKCTDLTGGTGIDTFYFSKNIKNVAYVEPQKELYQLAQYNFNTLNPANTITCYNDNAADFLQKIKEKQDLIYIDPSRRAETGNKVVSLQDCSPNVIELQEILLQKSNQVLIKASPMLDIRKTEQELKYIKEIYVIALNNEVKEVLFLLENRSEKDEQAITYHALNVQKNDKIDAFSFQKNEEENAKVTLSKVLRYVYEPNVALLKVGCFRLIAERFNLSKLHQHTHFYTSDTLLPDFQGRVFEVEGISRYHKKEVKQLLDNQLKANIITRNFPDTSEQIAQKLGIETGGNNYLLAATTALPEAKIIIKAKRLM